MTQGLAGADRQGLRRRDPRRRIFQITLPDGRTAYSRDGSFELDSQGRIVTAQGNVLNPGLTIPQNATLVTINAQGQVAATLPGNTTPTIVGQIQLAMFVNKAACRASATISISRRPPPARRKSAIPIRTASATCSRAISNRQMSRR
jgi:flagellar basal body rod protein FlgG